MKFLLSLFILLTSSFSIVAQDSLDVDISSPYNAVWLFHSQLHSESYNVSLASIPFEPQKRSNEVAEKLALQLKQVLDGNGIYLDFELIPKDTHYIDTVSKKHKYILAKEYPKIFLIRDSQSNNWVFSESSVEAIYKAHDDTFKYGSSYLIQFLPKLGTSKILGLYTYQYLSLLFIALLSVIIHRFFTFLAENFIQIVLRKTHVAEQKTKALRPIARPTSIFLIVLLLIWFIPALQLPSHYTKYIIIILRVLLPLISTVIAYRFVNILAAYFMKLATKTESSLDDQLVPLLRKTLKTFVVITGTLLILDNLNIPILPLLTGLSIGGLAFALAAQDTIKNFFGSLMIFVDKPFQIGDWIVAGDVNGTVEEVGFRSSRIRTFKNSLISIPNGKLADTMIDNNGLRSYRRFTTTITIKYDTPPHLIDAFTKGLREVVLQHPHTVKDNFHVYFNDLGSSSLNILFYIFFEVPTWGEELQCRHDILLKIMNLANALGVQFAFPTQTLHMEDFPGKPSLAPKYLSNEETETQFSAFVTKELHAK